MLAWLEDGRLDAMSGDDISLLDAAASNPNLQIVQPSFDEEPYSAGVRQRRPEFVAFINQVFRDVKASGRWTELYRKHITRLTGIVPDPPGL